MTDDGNGRNGNPASFDPMHAVRSAAAAAAVGAAVGALRALAARRGEAEAPPEDEGRTVESDEELAGECEPDESESTRRDGARGPEPEGSVEPEPDSRPEREPDPEPEPAPEPELRPQRRTREEPQAEPAPPGRLFELSERARDVVRELRGVEAEAVSGLARTPSGWAVTVEVVELHRIPESTDVLATYEVELADDGGLVRFERGRRYHRSESDEGDGR